MASYTKNLELLKKDPVADGADTFNIETMLNENWDKIDEKVATGKAMKDHVTNQENPHKVTAEQVGAASSVHSHTIDQVEGLNTALSNKADLVDGQVPYSQTPHLTSNKTIYVSPTGDDSNPGTEQAPFKTIQAAVDSLPRDLGKYTATILVAEGEYPEDVLISGFSGGSHNVGIKIVGSTAIDTTRHVNSLCISNNASYISVQGLYFSEDKASASVHIDASIVFCYLLNVSKSSESAESQGISIGSWSSAQVQLNLCNVTGYSTGIGISSASIATLNGGTISNCKIGVQVGNAYSRTNGIAMINASVVFSENALDKEIFKASQLFMEE